MLASMVTPFRMGPYSPMSFRSAPHRASNTRRPHHVLTTTRNSARGPFGISASTTASDSSGELVGPGVAATAALRRRWTRRSSIRISLSSCSSIRWLLSSSASQARSAEHDFGRSSSAQKSVRCTDARQLMRYDDAMGRSALGLPPSVPCI